MFIAMNRFRFAPGRETEFIEVCASATVTPPASPAFAISICCKARTIRKRRYSSPIPPGTVRPHSRLRRTRKPFAPPTPVQASSAGSISDHHISSALKPCCDVLQVHVGTAVHAGIQHEALCFFDQRSQNRFDREQWTDNREAQ
jgi:hypothetical protein